MAQLPSGPTPAPMKTEPIAEDRHGLVADEAFDASGRSCGRRVGPHRLLAVSDLLPHRVEVGNNPRENAEDVGIGRGSEGAAALFAAGARLDEVTEADVGGVAVLDLVAARLKRRRDGVAIPRE